MKSFGCIAVLGIVGLFSTCAHPHRISSRQLSKLAKSGDRFVLVFGSVRTLEGGRDITRQGKAASAAVRFTHQGAAAVSVLEDVPILSGDRFFAVLRAPAGARYLDHFDAAVRWGDPAYDAVTHIRLAENSQAFAMYIGRIEITVAEPLAAQRTSPKRTLSIAVRDDFGDASSELSRRYPKFAGEVIRSPALRSLQRLPSAPPRR